MNQQPSSLPWDVHGRQGRQIGQKDSKKTFRNAEGAENKYPRCKQPGPFFQPPPVALHSWDLLKEQDASRSCACPQSPAEQLHLSPPFPMLPWPACCPAPHHHLPPAILISSLLFHYFCYETTRLVWFLPLLFLSSSPGRPPVVLPFSQPTLLLPWYWDFPDSIVPCAWHVFWHASVHVQQGSCIADVFYFHIKAAIFVCVSS